MAERSRGVEGLVLLDPPKRLPSPALPKNYPPFIAFPMSKIPRVVSKKQLGVLVRVVLNTTRRRATGAGLAPNGECGR